MTSLELTTAETAIANAIASELSGNELALLYCIFVQLGDTLATIGSKRTLSEEKTKNEE